MYSVGFVCEGGGGIVAVGSNLMVAVSNQPCGTVEQGLRYRHDATYYNFVVEERWPGSWPLK